MLKNIKDLTLRKKFILLVTIIVASFAVFYIIIHRVVLFQSFVEIELHDAENNLSRAIHAIDREVFHLDNLCHDWASWDDMYQYAYDRNKAFEKSNLMYETFVTAGFNIICIIDVNDKIIFSNGFDTAENIQKMPSLFTDWNLINDSGLLFIRKDEAPENRRFGIIKTEFGFCMLAIRLILKSDGTGQPAGYLIMGKYLNDSFVEVLRDQTKVNFCVIDIYNTEIQENYYPYFDRLVYLGEKTILGYSEGNVVGYSINNDIFNVPAYIIHISFPDIVTD